MTQIRYTFLLPYPPVTGNHTTRSGRGRFWTAEKAKQYRGQVAILIRSAGLSLSLKGPLSIELLVAPPDRRARDQDNLQKVVFDSLTRAKFWADDSNKVIRKAVVEWTDPVPGGAIEMSVVVL